MDQGWIVTYGTPALAQVSITSDGGGGSLAPTLPIDVEDLDEALARMRAGGLAVVAGPADEAWGVR